MARGIYTSSLFLPRCELQISAFKRRRREPELRARAVAGPRNQAAFVGYGTVLVL